MLESDRQHLSADAYALALKVGGIAVVDWDPANDVAVWSPAWSQLLGVPVEELPTTLAGSMELAHPDDRPVLEQHLAALQGGAVERQAEYRLRHADGDWRWVRGSACMVRDGDGRSTRLVLVVVDGMPQRRAVEAAERRRRLEEVGRRRAAALIKADPTEIESAVVAGLGEFAALLGADRAALVHADHETGTMSERLVWAATGSPAPAPPVALPHFSWLVGQLSAGCTVRLGRRAELPKKAGEALRQRLEALSVEGLLLVPLVIDGRVAASVKLTSTEPTEWSADADAELALGAFANSCVQALRRRRLEDELREAHGHLQHLVERSPVSMWRLSRDGVLTPVGTSTAEALGYGPEELAQQPEQLVHPDDLHVVAAEMSQVQAGHEAHFEVRMRHAEGNWVTFETFVRPELDQDGEYTGAVGYGIDVTDRKIAEEQLRRAQKLEAVGQLAGGVAHDFNNLLTVIYGYIELARAGDTSALGEALAAAERARRLVERLLTFSRQRDVNAVSVDLNAAIRSMHRMVNLVGTDIDVQLDLAADLPPVTADVGQLEQAILNLAVNARDAMRTGGTLTLRTDQPDPREIPDDVAGERFVRLQVADTGIGMTPDVAARAVDPFFTTKDEGHGTGLGLSSVYGVLTALGGTVRFETTPGQGTTFELFLPVASSPPESPQAEGEATTARRIDGATILLVEDQAQVGDLVANILGRAGHHILLAPDGPTALELAEGRHIDLVITDVAMPHMRGPQVAAALRSRVPDLPVIYMSGYTGEALPSDERSWFLQKPFTIAQLHGATTTALEHAPRITD